MRVLTTAYCFEMSYVVIDIEGFDVFLEDGFEVWSIEHAELSEAWLDGWRTIAFIPSIMLSIEWI